MTEPLDLDSIEAEHFPWHYTEFGVECVCGLPADGNDQCAIARLVAELRVARHQLDEQNRALQLTADVLFTLDRHPGLLGHFLDTDDNDGQRLRDQLADLGIEPTERAVQNSDWLFRQQNEPPRWECRSCGTESAYSDGPHEYHEDDCSRPDIRLQRKPPALSSVPDTTTDDRKGEG